MGGTHLYELVLCPAEGSTGPNLVALLLALNVRDTKYRAMVFDVDCNNDRTWVQDQPISATPQQVIEYSRRVGQFDWASIFFSADSSICRARTYEDLFNSAELIVRAIDGTYFYVYTESADVTSRASIFPVESSELKLRDAIVHPF